MNGELTPKERAIVIEAIDKHYKMLRNCDLLKAAQLFIAAGKLGLLQEEGAVSIKKPPTARSRVEVKPTA